MARLLRKRFRRVLVDVDTQYDLVYGPQRDHAEILRNIRRLMAWARVHKISVISTALVRRPDAPNDNGLPPCCIEGTPGQKKIRYTMLASNVVFGPENRLDLPRHLLTDYQQIIFEKRAPDPFLQPRADRLLTELRADEFIVFGFGIDTAVKSTVLGLLNRRKRVLLAADAVGYEDPDALLALRKIEAKGARLVTTASITGSVGHLNGKVGNNVPWHAPMLLNARIG